MLFLGLGTGLGSALVSIEKRWRRDVADVIETLRAALEPDYVVVGGGNADKLEELPEDVRLGDNENAFLGGFRLWDPEAPARMIGT